MRCWAKQVGLLNTPCILVGYSSSENRLGPHDHPPGAHRLLLQMPGPWALEASCVTAANPTLCVYLYVWVWCRPE